MRKSTFTAARRGLGSHRVLWTAALRFTLGLGLGLTLGATFGCAPTAKLTAPAREPLAHEVFLLALDARGRLLVYERMTGGNDERALYVLDPDNRQRSLIVAPPAFDATLALLGTATDPRPLGPQATASALALDGDFVWLAPVSTRSEFDAPGVRVHLIDDTVEVCEGDECADALRLASSEQGGVLWLGTGQPLGVDTSIGATSYLGLEVTYDGQPRTRAAQLVDLRKARSLLVGRRALIEHRAGNYQAARELWSSAALLDPLSPIAAYNLACAHARLGDTRAALAALGRAITLGGWHYFDLAEQDADLATLSTSGELAHLRTRGPQPMP